MITEQVHRIWAQELNLDAFSDEDDFFALGGHSLLMVRLQAILLDEFDVEVPMHELFERPTVTSISAYLEEQRRRSAGTDGVSA